jgi:hypothetical protein
MVKELVALVLGSESEIGPVDTVPVNVGEASGAKPLMLAPLGIVTVPVNVGEASGAKPPATNAVVATFVLLSPAGCVTAVVLKDCGP